MATRKGERRDTSGNEPVQGRLLRANASFVPSTGNAVRIWLIYEIGSFRQFVFKAAFVPVEHFDD